jgi:uncharacterized membrane protein YoaK (UPF0700 family)
MMGHIWRKEMSIAKTQTSESFRLSALLSFSGGLQDAYTYNVRGGVFANVQTGNVVLMSQSFKHEYEGENVNEVKKYSYNFVMLFVNI